MKPTTRKKLAVLLGVLVLLGIIISVLLPSLIDPDQYHDRIVSQLEKAVGGKVSLGHVTWGIGRCNSRRWVRSIYINCAI